MRYLEVPDFHYSPKWGDVSELVGKAVREAAISHDVDFIALPGDLYDAPVMVTDKGGINQLRKIIKSWLDVCPVVAIQGTPSHDGPGCYGPLQDLGLILLQPGIIYGYENGLIVDNPAHPAYILFGIPEVTKQNVQANLALPADQANAEAVSLVAQYVAEYIAPMRAKYHNVPAIALLHGNVSDSHKDNEADIILRSSDIVIHTEDLAVANIDRWSLGHIHTPWESEVINAGYAGFTGMDSNPWGKRNFVPAMNLIELNYNGRDINKPYGGKIWSKPVKRIPYGTPMRKKITTPDSAINAEVAYWLETADADAVLPEHVHQWSRVTYKETKDSTRRVSSEQAKDVKTLGDMLLLLDPKATAQQVDAINSIPQSTHVSQSRVDLQMTYLKVQGCTAFFRDKTVEFDLSTLPDGVTALRGGNGAGKSSILSFCTPYPLVVGKDTSSGRISAIKDFFTGKDSLIEKRFMVNGQEHVHLITIRGAHTQSPKVECYLTIEGIPQLDKGTFDEMMEECEHIYGPFADYLPTTFYVQPLQGKTGSSLMSASMTDIRNLVQNIAGIDRSQESRYALDTLAKHTKERIRLQNWVEGASSFIADIEDMQSQYLSQLDAIPQLESAKATIEEDGLRVKADLDHLGAIKSKSDAERQRRDADIERSNKLRFENGIRSKRIEALNDERASIDSLQAKLDGNAKAKTQLRDIEDIERANVKLMQDFTEKQYTLRNTITKLRTKWQDDITTIKRKNEQAAYEHETKAKSLASAIASLERSVRDSDIRIESLNHPCPECGYIAPDIAQQIEEAKNGKEALEKQLQAKTEQLKDLVQPQDIPLPDKPDSMATMEQSLEALKQPVLTDVPKKPIVMTRQEEDAAIARLEHARNSGSEIATLSAQMQSADQEVAEIATHTYAIDVTIDAKVVEAESNRTNLMSQWLEANDALSVAKATASALLERIEGAKAQQEAVAKTQEDIKAESEQEAVWEYVSVMLRPAKIPALELELLLDSIDAEATRIISPYHDGRFSFDTETQSDGGVDRFDIMVHDNETGVSKSFMKFSPGQKAFLSDAYVKALVRQRNERSNRVYSPVIMDESDGPIEPALVGSYYEMQDRYWNCPVLAVSHSPASHEFIGHMVDVEELKGGE